MQHQTLYPQTLNHSEEIAAGVFLLSFQRNFDFLPGQVIGIGLQKNGPRRLYSICSGNNDPDIQILYNLVEEGYLTPRLSELIPGDTLWITEPRGEFLYDPGPGIWIATGTGIAPFYSMLRSGQFENKMLIHGERFLERFYFYDEFSNTLGINYIRCCTGEAQESVFHGRVTDYLLSAGNIPAERKYYLCGRAEMVVETRDILIHQGVPFHQIISEIYF